MKFVIHIFHFFCKTLSTDNTWYIALKIQFQIAFYLLVMKIFLLVSNCWHSRKKMFFICSNLIEYFNYIRRFFILYYQKTINSCWVSQNSYSFVLTVLFWKKNRKKCNVPTFDETYRIGKLFCLNWSIWFSWLLPQIKKW